MANIKVIDISSDVFSGAFNGSAAKKIKTKPSDFNEIKKQAEAAFAAFSVEQTVSEPVIEPAITPTTEESIITPTTAPIMEEEVKQAVESREESIIPVELPQEEIKPTRPSHTKTSSYSIINTRSPERVDRIASHIIAEAEKVDVPETDYDLTMVNGAAELRDIKARGDKITYEINDSEKILAAAKIETTAKKSDISLIEEKIRLLIPNPNTTAVLGRGNWSNDEIERVNDLIADIKDKYTELVGTVKEMEATAAEGQEDILSIEGAIKTKKQELDGIAKEKFEAVEGIKEALETASESDKQRQAADEIVAKAQQQVEERARRIEEIRNGNKYLNRNDSPLTKLEIYKALRDGIAESNDSYRSRRAA